MQWNDEHASSSSGSGPQQLRYDQSWTWQRHVDHHKKVAASDGSVSDERLAMMDAISDCGLPSSGEVLKTRFGKLQAKKRKNLLRAAPADVERWQNYEKLLTSTLAGFFYFYHSDFDFAQEVVSTTLTGTSPNPHTASPTSGRLCIWKTERSLFHGQYPGGERLQNSCCVQDPVDLSAFLQDWLEPA